MTLGQRSHHHGMRRHAGSSRFELIYPLPIGLIVVVNGPARGARPGATKPSEGTPMIDIQEPGHDTNLLKGL
jgi:hypothetical protein